MNCGDQVCLCAVKSINFPLMATALTVEEMLANVPREEQVIFNRLRVLVHECLPLATEKPYYGIGVPFYTHHRMICYLWPAAAVWSPRGNVVAPKQTGVTLGFCYGYRMGNEKRQLLSEGRKQVRTVFYPSLKSLDESQIRAWLFEASMIDDSFAKPKKQRRSA